MINLAGYEILNTVHESNNSLVYRGLRKLDNQPIILKFLKQDYPTSASLVRYKQEYEITCNLNLDSVPKAYSLEKYQNTLVIVFEDCNGESLKRWINNRNISLKVFLSTAIEITKALGEIHHHNIIHKDINPSNIIINPTNGLIQIIDFGISTVLTRENPTIKNPNVLEGTLTYISPEQTGRMNREIDYRTDFYSLGVTFYELLTGQLPFDYSDPMELIHCHIAKQAVPPHEINRTIPLAVSHIVMKLLAKTAEARYQSAWGIIADLEECLQQLQTEGRIAEFEIAQKDITNKFHIPQKLYGREREVETLLVAFDRVSKGTTEMMLVLGYSGIGKSALVQEVYKPITKAKGYFIAGKFDQFQRNIPYAAVVKAFKSLVKQLLTENETQLNAWKEKLLAAFGANGQIIIDVIPEVELIVGKQPSVQELGATESQNRFNLVFQKFIRVFCSVEHPLVIFLDDLQWADSATLKLLQVMMTDEETKYLFLMGAYRDNEVNPAHPLTMTLDELQKQGAKIGQIILTPLHIQQIGKLIAETLHKDTDSVMPLAELVVSKTQGNPFFVNQFLKTLYQENLLNFNFAKRNWEWNLSEIEALDITDNVVELMIGKLRKMPELTQQVLRLAACVGNSFDLNTLAIINEKSPGQTFEELLPAIQDGLILATSELGVTEEEIINSQLVITTYKFLHDRVQQSGYALIDLNLQTAVHLKIGRLLLANISPERQAERIFEIVDHLNSGRKLIADDREKVELTLLNITAGRRAKDATAYAAARNYLRIGLEILPGNIWQDSYELAFTLHKELADVEYLNGNFADSKILIEVALAQSKSNLEKAEVYNILIVQYTLLTKYEEAIQAGLQALRLLEIDLAEENLAGAVNTELAEAKANLANREISSLINAEKMKEPAKKMAMKLLGNMGPLTFFSSQELWKLTVVKAINISLKYGFVAGGSYCYSCYGIILNSILGDYHSAYEFGRLALTLSENSNNLSQNCQDSVIFANYLNCWVKPIKTTAEINNDGYKVGLQSGNLQWTGYNRMFQTITYFFQGMNLNSLLEDISNSLHFCLQSQNLWATDIIDANKLAILNFMGLQDEISEKQHLENFNNRKSMAALCEFYVLKAQTFYLDEQYNEAKKASDQASEIIDYLMGHISSAHHNFYRSLILTALFPAGSDSEQKNYWKQIEANQKQLKTWADNCPESFAHKFWLVAAEIARISGQDLEAMDLYDRAIASAREHDFIQNEALGEELAAKFWLGKGKEEFAQLYLTKAHYGYQLWGAKRKVENLEKKYPQLIFRTSSQSANKTKVTQPTAHPTTTTTNLEATLDLATVMKAAQAISGEIVLSKLLTRLMKIAIENAGAEKGFLILQKAGDWVIEAEGSVKEDEVSVLRSLPLHATAASGNTSKLVVAIANYVIRTQENVVLNNATQEGQFTRDPYVVATQPKSILCTPLLHQGKLTGILYLENNLTEGAFTIDRLELLKLLSAQIAISIENAQLYKNLQEFNQNLEQLVGDRTQELSDALDNLKAAQSKLVEAEKMASLGGLVAGVAHEINTPVGVGVTVASALAEHTTEFCSIYKSGKMKRSELEEFLDIAIQSSNTLLINLQRAAALIQSFKQVAVDQSSEERRIFQVKNYLDEILLQLKPKLRNTKHSIEVLGDNNISLDSYPGAFSQIVANLLINSLTHAYKGDVEGTILIHFQQEGDQLILKYSDDGQGIPVENLSKIYEPFFTTKRSQGGSGLGLHLVYNLVTQKLKGEIECQSEVGVGTQFVIKLPMQIDPKEAFGY
ncbi:ATP-binding sensor histidine kinase [Microcoleus sp. FACHB-672]|uniref:trifunctional serine/threonine-protein kinase/ATP-binding protein/sensor histidine kinase n=1 Tax=Microcoleus sp. FACHB-672 TaxID=2692825 RepID=UPI0016849B0E|nr:ATP-binding sensor histidine kinase [Microcoleus sp. FACHB-672]MBD2043518.1 AAA family ATPase [Microcoleus sp. FACHB-672]